VALYLAVAAQQFTRYAHPAGMDLTMAGIVPREAIGILVRALWPVLVTTNAILLLFYAVTGFVLGWLAGRFWGTVVGAETVGRSRWVGRALVATSLLGIAALAFATVAVRYPFQYDHLLNAQGGVLRRLQAILGRAAPGGFEAGMWVLIGLLALPAIVRGVVRRPAAAAAVLVAALGVGAWRPSPPGAGRNEGPNVVLIFLESARSDAFSVNGNSESTSPRLDRLVAEGGVTFTNAWSHTNSTVAEVVTVMTSAYAYRHGMRSMFHNEEFARPALRRLPALLHARGYATRVVTDWDGDVTYFNDRVLPGFDRYDVAEFGMINYVRQIYSQHFLFFALTDNRFGHRAFSVFYRAGGGYAPGGSDLYYRRRIEQNLVALASTPRFFLTLFFADPHFNYRCPYPYYARFTDPAYEGPNKYQAMSNPTVDTAPAREREARQIRGLYAGCIRELDDNIGFIADTLRRLGLDRQTLLVITGDHGERLPDRWSFRYGRNGAWLDPDQYRVPLLIIHPPVPVATPVVRAPVRHVDVMPTILELLGLPIPPGLDGTSLVPLITGAHPEPELEVFGETGFQWVPARAPYLSYPPMTTVVSFRLDHRGALIPRYFLDRRCLARMDLARHRFVRAGRYQLNYRPMVDGARVELYDWTADPGLRENLATRRPALAAGLKVRLLDWALGDSALTVRGGWLATRDPGALARCLPPPA
jgi:arylsulfatase A-like enzyme